MGLWETTGLGLTADDLPHVVGASPTDQRRQAVDEGLDHRAVSAGPCRGRTSRRGRPRGTRRSYRSAAAIPSRTCCSWSRVTSRSPSSDHALTSLPPGWRSSPRSTAAFESGGSARAPRRTRGSRPRAWILLPRTRPWAPTTRPRPSWPSTARRGARAGPPARPPPAVHQQARASFGHPAAQSIPRWKISRGRRHGAGVRRRLVVPVALQLCEPQRDPTGVSGASLQPVERDLYDELRPYEDGDALAVRLDAAAAARLTRASRRSCL